VDRELLPLIVFLLNTGCRKGEALACEWSWIDWRRRLLSLPVTEEWAPKWGRAREVPLGDVLFRRLRGMRKDGRWIFPAAHGGQRKTFPEGRWRAVVKAAGLRGGAHTTRHTFASHFLQVVPDLFELAAVLGQSGVRTTELYAHLLPGHLERARNAVNLSPDPGPSLARSRQTAEKSRGRESRH